MKILIAIHATHSQPEQMEAQHATWLQDVEPLHVRAGIEVHAKHFLGMLHCGLDRLPANGANVAAVEIPETSQVMLEMPDGPNYDPVRRGFGHRTPVCQRKTEAICKYALDNGYDFVFKVDDDTYVWVDRLLASGFEEHEYSGHTTRHYAADLGFYRFAEGGAGYWLSRDAMEIVVQNGLNLVPIEDYAVGQLLARHDIYVHHDERYCPTLKPCDTNWITVHQAKPEDMKRIWLKEQVCIGQGMIDAKLAEYSKVPEDLSQEAKNALVLLTTHSLLGELPSALREIDEPEPYQPDVRLQESAD